MANLTSNDQTMSKHLAIWGSIQKVNLLVFFRVYNIEVAPRAFELRDYLQALFQMGTFATLDCFVLLALERPITDLN